jgi:DnaK suppressor protein
MQSKDMQYKNKQIELPINYKPHEGEAYMNELQLEYFRRKLIDLRDEIITDSIQTFELLKEESAHKPDENDSATQENSIAITIRIKERSRRLIEKIDHALKRIKAGEYGFCEETGEEIGIRRLEVRPLTTLSLEAQERYEKYRKYHNDNQEDFST